MKTSELAGALLDYWVARAEGMTINPEVCQPDNGVFVGHGGGDLEFFEPSDDWAQGGPIIDRERIALIPDAGWRAGYDVIAEVEGAGYDTGPTATIELRCEHRADSPLVAAMRAYVARKFGDTVPDEVAA